MGGTLGHMGGTWVVKILLKQTSVEALLPVNTILYLFVNFISYTQKTGITILSK